jgi:hypothetical protein
VQPLWARDRDIAGKPLDRHTLLLGLSGASLNAFGRQEILEIIDLRDLVASQRAHWNSERLSHIVTPVERMYELADPLVAKRIGITAHSARRSSPEHRLWSPTVN